MKFKGTAAGICWSKSGCWIPRNVWLCSGFGKTANAIQHLTTCGFTNCSCFESHVQNPHSRGQSILHSKRNKRHSTTSRRTRISACTPEPIVHNRRQRRENDVHLRRHVLSFGDIFSLSHASQVGEAGYCAEGSFAFHPLYFGAGVGCGVEFCN